MKSFEIVITEKADKEFSEAFVFYEVEQSGLGEEFEKEINAVINILSVNPFLFQA